MSASLPAVFFSRGAVAAPRPAARAPIRSRSKLWELNPSVHCSIIGTCLTTVELRRVMGKVLQGDTKRSSDHDLHSQAVGLCTYQGPAAKLLQKALDQRHEIVVKRFSRISGEAAVLAAWAEARAAGDIPGAYWAVLTHPDVEHEGLRRAFGDVHMLSHLVGAANRADIRRLTILEEENAALRDKVERQQHRMHQAITERDNRIRQLGALVAGQAGASRARSDHETDDAVHALRHLAADLQFRLERETARRERLEARLAAALEAETRAESMATAARSDADAVRREIGLLEATIGATCADHARPLPAQRVLYVGGRPACVEQMREMLDAAGGALLSHDGGRHDHPSLLPGLIGQADQVVFPVDCVSHDAALTVKRVCRQLGKRFVPLRSSGVASFLAAIGKADAGAIEARRLPSNHTFRSCTCINP